MPHVRDLLYWIPALLVMLILMRIEVLLAQDVASRQLDVFHREQRLEYRLLAAIYVAHWLIAGSAASITVGKCSRRRHHPPLRPGLVGRTIFRVLLGYFRFLYLLAASGVSQISHPLVDALTASQRHGDVRDNGRPTLLVRNSRRRGVFASYLGILLYVPGDIAFPVVMLNLFVGAVTHFDVPIRLGKWSLCLNNPQWHRIHHSQLLEHRDQNFANFFPVFDLFVGLFGFRMRMNFLIPGSMMVISRGRL